MDLRLFGFFSIIIPRDFAHQQRDGGIRNIETCGYYQKIGFIKIKNALL